jgi:peptidyl-prolyl cis-trans isomerase C
MLGMVVWGQAPAPQAEADPVVFTVGTETMTRSQFEAFIANLPDQIKAQVSTPAGRRQMAERLAEMKSFAQEARRRKLAEKPAVQQQLKIQEDSVLAGALIQDLQEHLKLADKDLQDYYQAHLEEYTQTRARHILVRFKGSRVPLREGQPDRSDEEALAHANALRERVLKGEDFAAVAKAESDDTGSGAQGGDLGSFARGRMVPEFEKAAFAQPVGEVGQPMKSAFGYHIIQVQERGPQPFDQVRAEIERQQRDAGTQKAMDDLRAQSKVVLDEGYFGPAGAGPAQAGAGQPARPAPGTPSPK